MARIPEIVSTTPSLRILSEALHVTGIDETLDGAGPYTLFAPSEDAFLEMGADGLRAFAADPEDLAYTLRSHVVAGRHAFDDLEDLSTLETVEGTDLFVSLGEDGHTYIEEARIVQSDIEADNGIIHIIDLVVLPISDEVAVLNEPGPGDMTTGMPTAGSALFDREAGLEDFKNASLAG